MRVYWPRRARSAPPRLASLALVAALPLLLVANSQQVLAARTGGAAGTVDATWSPLPSRPSPLPRNSAGFAYDPVTREMVLTGGHSGCGPNPTSYLDTWALRGRRWVQMHPSGAEPGAMSFFSMAYDEATKQLVTVGIDTNCGLGTEMLSWTGTHWQPASSQLALPPPMFWSALAFDQATDRLLLFGLAQVSATGNTYLPETWSWNGVSWTQLAPATEPPMLENASLTYDPATRGLLLFGGNPYNPASDGPVAAPLGQTWSWNGGDWHRVDPHHSPPARIGAAAAYDPELGGVVLFGGSSTSVADGQDLRPLGDSWLWNGKDWLAIRSGQSPAPRLLAQMSYDPALRALVLFGGSVDNTADLADTWTLVPRSGGAGGGR